METYIPQTTKIPLNPKSRHSSDSWQLKRIIDNRTETTQQKRLLDTINAGQQVIQCTNGELCDEVKTRKKNIAPDKNFTSKHVRTPINNTDAINTHACRKEQAKINTLLDGSTLNLANIEFESNLPPTSESTPYHDTELVKTTCDIQETELKKVEPIPGGYFDLVKTKFQLLDELKYVIWDDLNQGKDELRTNTCSFPITAKAPQLLKDYKAAQQIKADRPKRKREKNAKKQEIKDAIEIEIKKYIVELNQTIQQAQDVRWAADQQTWVSKVKEKFSRIGNQNLKDTTYTAPSEIDSIPTIGSKEILIGIGKNSDENIFAFHYHEHK